MLDPLGVLPNQRLELDERAACRFAHGNEVHLAEAREAPALQIRRETASPEVLVTRDGELLGCGHIFTRDDAELLAPTRVFADVEPLAQSPQGSTPAEANG